MDIDLWPVVERAQLVRAFRPGERAVKEGPFRTLRRHGWATPGVSIVTRSGDRASGRLTIFSVLNVAAARMARHGDVRAAAALAKAAARVEQGDAFLRLKQLLSGRPIGEVSDAIRGHAAATQRAELVDAMRQVARETRRVGAPQGTAEDCRVVVVTGLVRECTTASVVVEAPNGTRTRLPRSLARAAERERVGDALGFVTDIVDDTRMVVEAVPGIDLAFIAAPPTTPFGRSAPVRGLTDDDLRLLRPAPAELQILVPVTVEA